MIARRTLPLALLALTAPVAGAAQDHDHGAHSPQHAAETMEEQQAETSHVDHVDNGPHAHHAPRAMVEDEIPPRRDADARALSGPTNAADAVWDAGEMAAARRQLVHEHGALTVSRFSIDRLEARIGKGADSYLWDAEYRTGGDMDGLVLSTEGVGLFAADVEHGEVQAVWRHAIGAWFDLHAGLRQDFGAEGGRTHLVIAAEGLLPYWIETRTQMFVSTNGDVSGRIEAEHDMRISGSLVLQPRAELDLSIRDAGEADQNSHLSLGLRLRYRATALVQPYLGFEWNRDLDGGDVNSIVAPQRPDAALLVGLKAMF